MRKFRQHSAVGRISWTKEVVLNFICRECSWPSQLTRAFGRKLFPPDDNRTVATARVPHWRVIDTRNDDSPAFLSHHIHPAPDRYLFRRKAPDTVFPSTETDSSSVNSPLFLFRKRIRVDTICRLGCRDYVHMCADGGGFSPVLLSLFAQIVSCGMVGNSQQQCEMFDLIAVDFGPASLL